ncbi:MAG TPA: hypothetical protein VL490_03085 [Mucilaginibacter sp.]|nr:hypothetical protein [Mucilaginibacter sp.]
MEKKFFETRLENLLMSKAFNNLSAAEKKYVLTLLTEEEYREYSLLLSNYKPVLLSEYDQIQPSPKVTKALTHAFRVKNNAKPVYFNIIRPQRVLTIAASLIILIGCILIFRQANKKEQPLTVKIKRQHAIDHTIAKAAKKEIREIKTYPVSGKKKTHLYAATVKKTPHYLCLDVAVEINNTPCLNPINTTAAMPYTYEESP